MMTIQAFGTGAAIARRDFLKTSSGVAAAAAFGAFSLPAFAAYVPPTRQRGSKVISVKDKGAVGDGRHDDTAAIQAAINALPSTGGTVTIPAGTYLIDPTRYIRLRSNMHLKMSPDAILKAKTCSVKRSYILLISDRSNVEISGGQLVGDRATHVYSGGGTHEWGHGIQILGGRYVTVRDLRVSKCTGDGVCVGGKSYDVVIANIVSTGHRRQGLSITNCSYIKVYDSEFSYTQGTSPECGIDIEPDPGYSCSNIRIENCRLNNNKRYGLNIWKNVSTVTVTRSVMERNGSLGMSTYGCSGITVTGNTVRYNSATGIVFNDGTRNVVHSGNLSYGNYTRLGTKTRSPFTLTGWSSKIERDILRRGSLSSVSIRTNSYK
jgi:parallel beta-helix repeat protein